MLIKATSVTASRLELRPKFCKASVLVTVAAERSRQLCFQVVKLVWGPNVVLRCGESRARGEFPEGLLGCGCAHAD